MRSPARRMSSGPGLPGWLSRAIETGVHPWGHVMAPSGSPAGESTGMVISRDLIAGQRGGWVAEG